MPINSQSRMIAQSMKDKIAQAIVAKLETIPVVKYVAFDKVRLLSDDFKDFECPAIQLIDDSETGIHENVRLRSTWFITLELLMRGNENLTIFQRDLWNLEYEVKRKLWSEPNLGIKGVIHLKYLGTVSDLHVVEPFYFSRLGFTVEYYENLVTDC